jgi:hypothetical protein
MTTGENENKSKNMFLKEFIDDVLFCYLQGMCEVEIADALGMSHKEIVEILDIYTKYL